MKILHAQVMAGVAGSETVLRSLLPALAARSHEIHFLCLHDAADAAVCGAYCDELDAKGVATHRLVHRTKDTPRTLAAIDRLIARGGYDIVHAHLLRADVLLAAARFAFGRGFRLVSTKHGYNGEFMAAHGLDPSRRVRDAYWYAAVAAEHQITASSSVSAGLAHFMSEIGIVDPARQFVTALGFDYPAPPELEPALRTGSPQLVLVGRLVRLKGQDVAINCIAALAPEFPDISLTLVGGGESEAELRSLASRLGVDGRVTFAGPQSQPARYLAASDVVLVPSMAEGFGIVVLEGMAAHRPVVAFDVPAPNEIIEHERSGILVPPYSVPDFTEAIRRILRSPTLAYQLAERGAERLRVHYSSAAMTDGFETFYAEAQKLPLRATWRPQR